MLILCMFLSWQFLCMCVFTCITRLRKTPNRSLITQWMVAEPWPSCLHHLLHKYSSDGNCCQAPSWSTELVSARLNHCWTGMLPLPCLVLGSSGYVCMYVFIWHVKGMSTFYCMQCACEWWKKNKEKEETALICVFREVCVCKKKQHFTKPGTRSHRMCVASRPPCTAWHHHNGSWNSSMQTHVQARTHMHTRIVPYPHQVPNKARSPCADHMLVSVICPSEEENFSKRSV